MSDARQAARQKSAAFAGTFGSAVASQAVLSVASLVVGLVMIRRASDQQYGYFVLASGAMALLASLQGAFFSPPLAIRMARLDRAAREQLVGGLRREQARLALALGAIALVVTALLWFAGVLDAVTGPLALAVTAAGLAVLNREYFRTVLLTHHRAWDVLRTDALHALVLVAGVLVATLSEAPAAVAVLGAGAAALASGVLLSRALRRYEPWDLGGRPGILREVAPLAAWSTAGAAIHWSFSQGYTYLVAGTLDLATLAAVAATRLTVMPVNMLSAGIGLLMLPMVSRWLPAIGPVRVLRRLALGALGLAVLALVYFAVLWALRDWVFGTVLGKQFGQRDLLLALWCAALLVMVVRDQFVCLVAASGRFRALTLLVLGASVLSLAVSYRCMLAFGAMGAPLGILVGELINLGGIIALALRETRRGFAGTALAAAGR